MPAFQSVAEFGLAQKYRLKAVGCEESARQASDQITELEWHELAAQWHDMAAQAAKMPSDAEQD